MTEKLFWHQTLTSGSGAITLRTSQIETCERGHFILSEGYASTEQYGDAVQRLVLCALSMWEVRREGIFLERMFVLHLLGFVTLSTVLPSEASFTLLNVTLTLVEN